MFDPLDDMIDLRDVVEIAEGNPDEGDDLDAINQAQAFIRAMVEDLGLGDETDVARMADDEPTVIARRYFREYAQDLASEVWGGPGRPPWEDNSWPAYCIDWEYAARELAYDYSTFTYDGREYLIRSV